MRRGLLLGLNLALVTAIVVLLLLGGSGSPPQQQAPTSAPAPAATRSIARAAEAVDQLLSHTSAARGEEVRFWAYAPVLPEGAAPLPVLYLLHGAGGNHSSWHGPRRELLLELAVQHQLVIVAPDGRPYGWYLDSPVDPTSRIETWLIQELIPHVERSGLPVAPGRRAIAGLSMGGHGALVLALRNPDTFTSASSMSGIVDPLRHPRQWGLPDVLGELGPTSRPDWERHSAMHLLGAPGATPPPGGILLTVGSSDGAAVAENRDLHDALQATGVQHGWQESDGGHDWRYWRRVLPDHVAFHARALAAH